MKRYIYVLFWLLFGIGVAVAAPEKNQAFVSGARLFGYPEAQSPDELARLLSRDWKSKPREEARVLIQQVVHRCAPLEAWIAAGRRDRESVSLTYISALLGKPAGTLNVEFRCDATGDISSVECVLSEK